MFLFAAACITSAAAFSQHFQHSIGASMFIDQVEGERKRPNFALTYNPRFNFVETASMSVSAGIPVSIGFYGGYSRSTNTSGKYYDANIFGFALNAPLMVNLNLGGGSSRKCNKRIGGFIGGGYGYHYAAPSEWKSYKNDEIITTNRQGVSTMGVAANGGVRFGVGRNYSSNIEVRLSYFRGSTQYKMDLYGVGCSYNF